VITRRELFAAAAAPALLRAASLTPRERVDRVIAGKMPDRAPVTLWYHFLDESKPGGDHAKTTLDFHKRIGTDLVKVMSDYHYPQPAGEWFSLKASDNPFPEQIRALEQIHAGLGGEAHFVETLFSSYQVAEKLSSKEAVAKMKAENPQRLLDAIEVINRSQSSHARRAIAAGASGIFLSITTSADPDYARFGEPFDRAIYQAVRAAPLNILHIHGDTIDLAPFYKGWPVAGINYSIHGTKIPFAETRKHYPGILMGGWDEVNFRKLSDAQLREQAAQARKEAGTKLILAGGCSVPNDTKDEELLRAIKS
jgi:hypothetical protein